MIARWRLLLLLVLLLVVGAGLWIAAARWAQSQAEQASSARARQQARADAGLLTSELQKFRLLPLVLVEYPDVADALQQDSTAADQRVDRTLELLSGRTDAAAIYVIDAAGRTVAASNWRSPASFVGQNYGFRPYFRDAMRSGASELFALGTVSGRPGLFLARRVDRGGVALGVVVVKVEFDRIEGDWARDGGLSFVVDRHGVILITSVPDWRFRTTHPLDAATVAETRRTLQFGAAPLHAAPVDLTRGGFAIGTAHYRTGEWPVPLGGARLVHLQPLAPALAAASARVRFWTLMALLVLGGLLVLAIRAWEQRRTRARLEKEVDRRTGELREANERLLVESRERIEADRRFRAAREELTQANRLGSLGQITAGVAHEINQPVAAIRTYAENAELFLDRDRPEQLRGNLRQIIDLTTRIGTITAELRHFARRRTPQRGAVPVEAVIDGALLLVGDRVREMVRVTIAPAASKVQVIGDRVRLEQILVNLLQNAAEAIAGRAGSSIALTVEAGDDVTVRVADDGPGVPADIADQLFTPFVTGKPDGLGLGLGIARDIARDFEGELTHRAPPGGGAVFMLRLRIA